MPARHYESKGTLDRSLLLITKISFIFTWENRMLFCCVDFVVHAVPEMQEDRVRLGPSTAKPHAEVPAGVLGKKKKAQSRRWRGFRTRETIRICYTLNILFKKNILI